MTTSVTRARHPVPRRTPDGHRSVLRRGGPARPRRRRRRTPRLRLPADRSDGTRRSRVGLAVGDEVTWLDEVETQQRYVGDTTLIETVHETDRATVTRHDVTLGDAHLTRVTIDVGDDGHANVDPADLSLVVYARFAPDGRDNRVGQLRYDDAIEVYHADEHDFLASDTGFTDLRGQLRRRSPSCSTTRLPTSPRDRDGDRYEEERLSGEVIVDAPSRTASRPSAPC